MTMKVVMVMIMKAVMMMIINSVMMMIIESMTVRTVNHTKINSNFPFWIWQWYTWRIVTISSEEEDDDVEAVSHLSSVDTDNDIGTSCILESFLFPLLLLGHWSLIFVGNNDSYGLSAISVFMDSQLLVSL